MNRNKCADKLYPTHTNVLETTRLIHNNEFPVLNQCLQTSSNNNKDIIDHSKLSSKLSSNLNSKLNSTLKKKTDL